MTLPQLMAFNKYWRRHPPLHIMVQSYLGIKPKEDSGTSDVATGNDFEEFVKASAALNGASVDTSILGGGSDG